MSASHARVHQGFSGRIAKEPSAIREFSLDSRSAAVSAGVNTWDAAELSDAPAPPCKLSLALKRLLDIAMASAALVALAPLLLCVALLIRLQDGRPALFRQRRGGLNGAPFLMFKFRTMSVQQDGDRIDQAQIADPRVTRIGAFLRRTSIDELPQLLNVLKGDMSLVGPRPHALAHDEYYGRLIAGYVRRFEVQPGITGLAQITGHRGPTPNVSDMERRVRADIEYVMKRSFLFDIKILWNTALSVLRHKNAF